MIGVIGPNQRKLIAHKAGQDAVPVGGGLEDALRFLTTPGAMAIGWHAAAEWTESALMMIRSAAGPNPWKYAPDEDIAGELLRRLDERKNAAR
jgi:hypothetical protein